MDWLSCAFYCETCDDWHPPLRPALQFNPGHFQLDDHGCHWIGPDVTEGWRHIFRGGGE